MFKNKCRQKIVLSFQMLLFLNMFIQAQNYELTGEVVDNLGFGIENASVNLRFPNDSIILHSAVSDEMGFFSMEIERIDSLVILDIEDDMLNHLLVEIESITGDMDLGKLKITGDATQLEALNLFAEIPPITIRADTIEFKARSFPVRQDANVEELIRELSGVFIDDDGKITINGKPVDEILVNGKPFFDKEGNIAIKSLPADIIDKIQVSDTKTRQERLSGDIASGENATINLILQEDKNYGYMVKAHGGYGTDNRYESSAMGNYFKGDTKFSVLGSSNNINSVDFSSNDIFDNMSQSRNNSIRSLINSSYNLNRRAGITQTHLVGANYTDFLWDKVDLGSNYFFTNLDTRNTRRTRTENFLPDGNYINSTESETRNQSFNHNFYTQIEYKIDSTSSIWVEPRLLRSKQISHNDFSENTVNESGGLLNENFGFTHEEIQATNFENLVNYYKSFNRKSNLSVDFTQSNHRRDSERLNQTETYFYQTDDEDEIRNQILNRKNEYDSYELKASFDYKISDSTKLNIGLRHVYAKDQVLDETFDYNHQTNAYDQFNALLSNDISSSLNRTNPSIGIVSAKKNLNYTVTVGALIHNQNNTGHYLDETYRLNNRNILPSVRSRLRYNLTDKYTMTASYNYYTSFPFASQLLPIENLSNPLVVRVGNPDLDPNQSHQVVLGLKKYNMRTKTGYNISIDALYRSSQVIPYNIINESFITTSTFTNISGNYYVSGDLNFHKNITRGIHKYRFSARLAAYYNDDSGYINGQLFDSKRITISPRLAVSWDLGEFLSLKPSYNFSYTQADYTNYVIDRTSNIRHNFRLETHSTWPKNVVFDNDFTYNYNSNIADGFQKDFFMWNTGLGYNFFKDTMTFKVKVYDILNQNISNTRRITETTIHDEENIVLGRYLMFTLSYRMNKFGG